MIEHQNLWFKKDVRENLKKKYAQLDGDVLANIQFFALFFLVVVRGSTSRSCPASMNI